MSHVDGVVWIGVCAIACEGRIASVMAVVIPSCQQVVNPKLMTGIKTYIEQVSSQWDGSLARLKAFVEDCCWRTSIRIQPE